MTPTEAPVVSRSWYRRRCLLVLVASVLLLWTDRNLDVTNLEESTDGTRDGKTQHYSFSGPVIRKQRGLPPKILFHHAHKTGGTSACSMARNNGEITPEVSSTYPEEPVCYYSSAYCGKDLDALSQINSTVTYVDFHCGAHAHWRKVPRPDWMLVTFLRHPLERLLSEYRHYGVDRVFADDLNLTTEEKRNDRDLFMKYAKTRANFYRRFYVPHCSGNDLVDCIHRTFQQYDTIIILEDFVTDCPRLAAALGWRAELSCSTHKNADRSNRTKNARTFLGKKRTKKVMKWNAMDVAIYNYARELAEKQRQAWLLSIRDEG